MHEKPLFKWNTIIAGPKVSVYTVCLNLLKYWIIVWNIQIWCKVVKQYFQEYFQEVLLIPPRKLYPPRKVEANKSSDISKLDNSALLRETEQSSAYPAPVPYQIKLMHFIIQFKI